MVLVVISCEYGHPGEIIGKLNNPNLPSAPLVNK